MANQIPHATNVHNHNIPYWTDVNRGELYYIPPESDVAAWSAIKQVVDEDHGGRVRVLKSRSTPGFLSYAVEDDGTPVVQDWTHLPDLVLFNVPQYFLDHPNIESIWIETADEASYEESSAQSDPYGVRTASSGDSQGSRSIAADSRRSESTDAEFVPDYALVLRRTECTYNICRVLRNVQRSFFDRTHTPVPRADDFSCNLHGR